MSKYTEKDILDQLDQCVEDFVFPMLDNGYIHLITSKMTAYRDESRWALIIEVVGFSYRGGGHNGISNCLHIFGNCIDTEPGTDDNNFIYLTKDTDIPSFEEEYQESLNPKAKTIQLRDQEIKIHHDRDFYTTKGIELEEEGSIFIWEFLRGLTPEYDTYFFATQEEIRNRIPMDLPNVLDLTEWYHPDCAMSELPSQNETFQQIAAVLAKGNVELYQPTHPANNHWSNWPDGGSL